MADVSSIGSTLLVREPKAISSEHASGASVAKHLVLMFSLVIVTTLCGCYWLFQSAMVFPTDTIVSTPWGMLVGASVMPETQGFRASILVPLLTMLAVWFGLILMAVRIVRHWTGTLLEKEQVRQQKLLEQVTDLESRLMMATHTAKIWQDQVEDLTARVKELEAIRTDYQNQVDQHARQAKSLAQQQLALARSKEVLEQRIEARSRELERQQGRYESILNSAGEGICSCDLEGKIVFANPAAVTMTGWRAEDLLGRQEGEVFADFAPLQAGTVNDDAGARGRTTMFRRKDGTLFPVEIVRTPVEENRSQVGTVLIFKDVTERTKAMEQLAHKAAELARSNAELEQFAFVASHDLQEPLRKIQAFGDRLKARCGDTLKAESQDYLQRMQSAAARMQVLIDSLLTYSRVLTREQPFAPVDLAEITREVLGDLEVRIEKSGAKVVLEQLPTIEADALQIRQLLQNLISNALKFQPAGNTPQVKITARLLSQGRPPGGDPSHTEIRMLEQVCELTVEDNGIGFDEAYSNRIFAVFQRLHGRNEYEGTGIGLAVCRKIVSRHRGNIAARSTPGQGARFIVTLPVRQSQPHSLS